MDPEIERYYRALNLQPTASPEEIYQAYRDLVRVWDPSRFANQPHLELMAEAKLKEIIEAYNALASRPEVSGKPAPQEAPELLTPVPDHVADRNVPQPVLPPEPAVAAEFGRRAEEPEEPPAEPLPKQAWELERPPSYPTLAAQPATPAIEFVPPPPPPPSPSVLKVAAQFSPFLIPVLLAGLGLYLYDSAPSRPERQDQLPAAQGSAGQAPAAHPTEAAPIHHAKKASRPGAEETEAALISLPNGAQLMPPRGPTGAGRFRIANRSGEDAVVRVASQAAPGVPLRLVYVQAGTEVPIENIATGVYLVYVSLGPLTKASRKFAPPLGPFQFMQIESVDGPQSDDYQIVVKPTP